jgi:hypothetical protein
MITSAIVLGVALSSCAGEDASEEATTGVAPGDSSSDSGSSSTGHTPELPTAADSCVNAPTIGPGRWKGALLPPEEPQDGVCGLGGPDAFFRVEIPRRADLWIRATGEGFSPRLAVHPDVCTGDAPLTCSLDGGGPEGLWLYDLLGGSALRLAVGMDPDDPLLGDMVPISFTLDLDLRRVLEAGELCMPEDYGRCVSGTVCAPPDEDDMSGDKLNWRCVSVDADTCADAELVVMTTTETTLELPGPPLQSDAHYHSCGGEGLVERVFQIRVPEPLNDGEELRVAASSPALGLAARAPGCLLDDERACTAPGTDGVLVVDLATAGGEMFLFVEWPVDAEGLDALSLTLTRQGG